MVAIGSSHDAARYEQEPLLLPAKRVNYTVARAASEDHKPPPSVPWHFYWWQAVLVASVAAYALGHTVFTAPVIQLAFMNWLGDWWTEPSPDGQPKAHVEMIRPSILILLCVVPFTVGTIALEWTMRGPQRLQRVVSSHVLRLSVALRRKPSSYWLRGFSNGELLFLSLLIGGNAALFGLGWITMLHYYPLPGTEYTGYTTLEVLGVVLGYNSVYNMAFLFLPTTRSSAWMDFCGVSYANGMKFHRWLGVATLATALGHALPFYPVWYHSGVLWEKAMPCFDCSLDYFSIGYPAWFNVFGEISLLLLLLLGATSLPWVRRRHYEWFYYAHYLFVPGVVFAVLHWGTIVWWLLPSFTLYLVDRAVGSVHAVAPSPIEECTVLSDGILKIVVTRAAEASDFTVGQFVYLNIPAISKWQWHAFTIGSSPRASPNSFTVWLKSLGDWTEDLVQYTSECAAKKQAPVVYVDGYYGASLELYDQYAALCLVGGGIGVTPLFAMLEDMATAVETNAVHWPRSRRVHFVFSFREVALLGEIHSVLQTLRTNAQTRDVFSFEFFLTRTPSDATLDQVIHRSTQPLGQRSAGSAVAFAQPLRSRTYRAVLHAVVIISASAAIVWLDYDGGVMMAYGAKTQYWPLQNLVDCLVLFVVPLLAYVFLAVEKAVAQWRQPHTTAESSMAGDLQGDNNNNKTLKQREATDIHTYRDLLAEYGVIVGARPDMQRTMARVHADYQRLEQCGSPTSDGVLSTTIGVFVSGPEALKRATEDAIATIDPTRFDIHDEEFEL